MELLKKRKRYLSTNEMAEMLKVGKSTTIMSLRKMRDRKEIKFKKEGNSFYYKI